MFTRPSDITDANLDAVLHAQWGFHSVALDYVAVGFGSHHWRAATAAGDWFVTVDDLVAKRQHGNETLATTHDRLFAALETARTLLDAGFEFVVAPVLTTDGRVAAELDQRYVVAVYPLLHGQTFGYGDYTDDTHCGAVLDNLARLHLAPESCRRWALTDTLAIPRRDDLFAGLAQLDRDWESGPFAEPCRQLLAEHADAVVTAFAQFDELASHVGARPDRFVVTHGEPHRANTIVTERGVLLIDWDTTLIAPPERDLWQLVGHDRSVAARYESLTDTPVDNEAIELYRRTWDLAEVATYVSDFRQPHAATEDMTESWQNLQYYLGQLASTAT